MIKELGVKLNSHLTLIQISFSFDNLRKLFNDVK